MPRLFKFIACLLAVLWLPAALHCEMEAAGFSFHQHEAESDENCCPRTCERGSCSVLSEGVIKNLTALIKVSAPILALCVTQLVLVTEPAACFAIAPSVSPHTTDSPPELARTWQFTARTALLPGAPAYSV